MSTELLQKTVSAEFGDKDLETQKLIFEYLAEPSVGSICEEPEDAIALKASYDSGK